MTETRRSLAAGLAVVPPGTDPEVVRRFVTQEAKPTQPATEPAITDEPDEAFADAAELPPNPSEASGESPRGRRSRRSKKGGLVPVGLVPVTVRLKPEIAGALKTASLQRQLAGDDVFTQQDLVELALEPWLREQGYLE